MMQQRDLDPRVYFGVGFILATLILARGAFAVTIDAMVIGAILGWGLGVVVPRFLRFATERSWVTLLWWGLWAFMGITAIRLDTSGLDPSLRAPMSQVAAIFGYAELSVALGFGLYVAWRMAQERLRSGRV